MIETSERIFLSLIVPTYNEEEVIDIFYERTVPILSIIDKFFEIVFINDGSQDKTVDKIKNLRQRDARVKLIDLSRNFGKEIAVTAGLDFCQGEVVVIIDADLQDPPEIIPEMVNKWKEGYDTVGAKRVAREGETHIKKFTARVFYRIIRGMTRINIPENTGDYRLINRRTVEALKMIREQHRFMKGLFSWVGFKQIQIPYKREARAAGRTKWNYWRLWNFAIEGITSFSYAPLQIATYLGVGVGFFAFLYLAFLVIRTLIFGRDVPGYASIMVTVLFLCGCQLVFLGIIGEYLGRLFDEVKGRPLYLVQNLLGLENKSNLVFKNNSNFEAKS